MGKIMNETQDKISILGGEIQVPLTSLLKDVFKMYFHLTQCISNLLHCAILSLQISLNTFRVWTILVDVTITTVSVLEGCHFRHGEWACWGRVRKVTFLHSSHHTLKAASGLNTGLVLFYRVETISAWSLVVYVLNMLKYSIKQWLGHKWFFIVIKMLY